MNRVDRLKLTVICLGNLARIIRARLEGTKGFFRVTPHIVLQGGIYLCGVALLSWAFMDTADAATTSGGITYNDSKITNSVNAIMLYLEGSFGALVMAAAGIGAIVAAAFGGYKASLSLMVVAIGAFILRSIMSTFFNDRGIIG